VIFLRQKSLLKLVSNLEKENNLTVAICQLTSTNNIQHNINCIKKLISQITEQQKVDFIGFPENALYLKTDEADKFEGAFLLSDPIIQDLSEFCSRAQVTVHLGSINLIQDENIYNCSLWLEPGQAPEAIYKKIHLFDVEVGDQKLQESDTYSHGENPKVFDFKGWKLGFSICYDLRFSELFYTYAKQQVDLILVPSAFLVSTGTAHWHTLLKARAIECQSYVLAAAQSGPHGGKRNSYGHSLCVDPWGKIIAEVETVSPDFFIVELSKGKIDKVRSQIPMSSHRRL